MSGDRLRCCGAGDVETCLPPCVRLSAELQSAHMETYPGENDPAEACMCPLGRDHTLREWIKWETERDRLGSER